MIALSTEMERLETLYDSLEAWLDTQYQELLAGSPGHSPRNNKSSALDVQSLDAERTLARLIAELDDQPGGRGEESTLSSRAARMRIRAEELQKLVERNQAEFRRRRDAVRNALQELNMGGQFLSSMREHRHHPPKYLDARQ
jgi:hypothetical protein